MKIETRPMAPLYSNCYYLTNEETRELALVDPGGFRPELLKEVQKEGLNVVALLLTHGHFDHILGIRGWKSEFPDLKIMAAREEQPVLRDMTLNMTNYYTKNQMEFESDIKLEDNETFTLLGQEFRFILTPGHTQGSGCYYIPSENTILTGDTLFNGSYGRYDLPTGDFTCLQASLRQLMELPNDTIVLPGHGEPTTIGREKGWILR